MDVAAAGQAIVDGRFADVSGACTVAPIVDEVFPLSVVRWDIESASRSRICLDRTLLTSDRLPFFAQRLAGALPIIEAAHTHGKLSPNSVLLNLDDMPLRRGLAFCSDNESDLLIPDSVFVREKGYQRLRDNWAQSVVPWTRRLPVVFWRGSTSGRMPQDRDWRKLPRIMMCKLASTRPDVFDVGISYSANLPDDAGAEIRAGGLERARIPDWAFNYYRYHIDIDGNTNAWASLFIKLLSGSPVLKVTSPHGFRQWYYDRLKPWVHYVPVEADMSDLIEKAEWIRNHDADAVRMGRAAQSLAADMTLDAEVNLAGERVAAALDHRKVKRMRTIPATQIMMKIHGADIYEGFTPELAEDLQGWNSTSPIFAEIIKVTRPNIIVDVGVWKGASTLFFANLLRANGIDGAVIAVGTFLGGIEHWLLDSPHYDKMPRRHGKPILYEQFLSNVVRHDLAGYVVPLPQSSLIAAMLLRHHRITVDLVHIDADHSYEAVMSDARTYWTLLNPGGYLIGDDYDKGWPGVVQAADEFAAEMGIELTISSPKWIARKPLPV